MAAQKPKIPGVHEHDDLDLAELAKEVQQLELLARRSEAKLRRLEADTRLRELVAKNRPESSSPSQ